MAAPLAWFDKLTTSGVRVPLTLSEFTLSGAEGKEMSGVTHLVFPMYR